MYSHGMISIAFSKVASPDFASLVDKEQTAEGRFRGAHHRLAQHAEGVAFLHGERSEEGRLNEMFEPVLYTTKQRLNQASVFKAFQSFLFVEVPFM